MEIVGYKCPTCKDIVYSRARHDCRSCSCRAIYVDGGFEYTRIGSKTKFPQACTIEVNATQKELFDDWNFCHNKFGLIKEVGDSNVV